MDATLSVRLAWIDRRINYWRKRRGLAETQDERVCAEAHIDAYQLMRTAHGYPPLSDLPL